MNVSTCRRRPLDKVLNTRLEYGGRLEWKYFGKLSTPFQYFSTPYACPRSDLMDKHMSGFRLFSCRTDERGDFRSPPLLGVASTLHLPKCVDTGVSEIFFYDPDKGEEARTYSCELYLYNDLYRP